MDGLDKDAVDVEKDDSKCIDRTYDKENSCRPGKSFYLCSSANVCTWHSRLSVCVNTVNNCDFSSDDVVISLPQKRRHPPSAEDDESPVPLGRKKAHKTPGPSFGHPTRRQRGPSKPDNALSASGWDV